MKYLKNNYFQNNQLGEMADLDPQEFKLSRVCSSFDKGKWKIHQFGYNQENKPVKKVAIVEDYF